MTDSDTFFLLYASRARVRSDNGKMRHYVSRVTALVVHGNSRAHTAGRYFCFRCSDCTRVSDVADGCSAETSH